MPRGIRGKWEQETLKLIDSKNTDPFSYLHGISGRRIRDDTNYQHLKKKLASRTATTDSTSTASNLNQDIVICKQSDWQNIEYFIQDGYKTYLEDYSRNQPGFLAFDEMFIVTMREKEYKNYLKNPHKNNNLFLDTQLEFTVNSMIKNLEQQDRNR